MTGSRQKNSHHKQGQNLVEFAIILPLLLLIAFGVLDLGRLFHAAITVASAAREGARYATFYPDDDAGIRLSTQAESAGSGIDLTSSTILITCPEGCDSGLPIRVTIQYDFQLILGFVLPDPTIQIARYAEMMVP